MGSFRGTQLIQGWEVPFKGPLLARLENSESVCCISMNVCSSNVQCRSPNHIRIRGILYSLSLFLFCFFEFWRGYGRQDFFTFILTEHNSNFSPSLIGIGTHCFLVSTEHRVTEPYCSWLALSGRQASAVLAVFWCVHRSRRLNLDALNLMCPVPVTTIIINQRTIWIFSCSHARPAR
jgi:hypothetical protein